MKALRRHSGSINCHLWLQLGKFISHSISIYIIHLYPSYALIATKGNGVELGLPPCFTPTTTTLLQSLTHAILFLSYAFLLKSKDENTQFMKNVEMCHQCQIMMGEYHKMTHLKLSRTWQNLNSAPGATYKSICSDLIKSGAIQSAKVGKVTLQFKIQQNTLLEIIIQYFRNNTPSSRITTYLTCKFHSITIIYVRR